MNQVHKENLTQVENAIPGRQGLDIEIFGMEGVPDDITAQHQSVVTEQHFDEEAERQRLSGNPARGAALGDKSGVKTNRERVREELEEIEDHAEKWVVDRKNGVARPAKSEAVAKPVSIHLIALRGLVCILILCRLPSQHPRPPTCHLQATFPQHPPKPSNSPRKSPSM
jgi:hypothetical protein